ncbi:quaternary amine ABC transporter ATP-binding protein [Oleiagrimonas soli]|uniref:Quaternary amine transport ATP-binding protein n=1 Tax=Oleiagrimonas soli TaxID=1543381 RepID=A0A099CXH3_9GAMM|nr:glycine betaine/L-proline ABC transporter ATP-binding protein [Oleiagrimonas soli]KGI78683.1 glycine/betaine ABC transporter ATP-binding protein [Oleiagrimonas soli]MBB6183999.1 glycine betaine/proline transport system ATP-binding protein [Oleiagrimonas soli]
MTKIRVEKLTKIFGPHPEQGLRMLDEGKSNAEIRETGQAVGIADVSFEVQEGEFLVVMGLSGSGKSTLIRCLNRLNEPTRGHIFIDGDDITRFDREHLLKLRQTKISMVFQHFALFPHRTVVDNAAYGLEIQGIDPDERRRRANEALELVGLKGWADAYPGQLSGGMQQRVGLARALAVEPDILLMDEAFSALDPLIRRDMQHEMMQLQQRVKKTIVFITHDLDEALQVGDRIVLMKDGRVVQIGTPEDILNNPANAYVERFVENVDMSRVLTAQSVLQRARVLAFPNDGPRTVLRKMADENYASLLVVNRDYTLIGSISAEAASQAVKDGVETIGALVEETPSVPPTEPLMSVIGILADWRWLLPVIDENNKVLGVVTRAAVLTALAENNDTSVSDAERSDAA